MSALRRPRRSPEHGRRAGCDQCGRVATGARPAPSCIGHNCVGPRPRPAPLLPSALADGGRNQHARPVRGRATCHRTDRQPRAQDMRLGGRRFLLSLAIIGASVCLALGVSLPIIKLTKYVFWTTEHSLLSTVYVLIKDGQTFLGFTVLLFSIVFPVLKLLYLLLVSTLPRARDRAPGPSPARARMARQMVDARRAGAGADDLLHQEPGRLRRGEPQRRLLLHRRRRADDPVLRMAAGRRRATAALRSAPPEPRRAWHQPAEASRRAHRHGRRRSAGAPPALDLRNFVLSLLHHPGDRVLRARHHPAGDPLHDGLRVDQRALDRDHHLGALHRTRNSSCARCCSCSRSSSRS